MTEDYDFVRQRREWLEEQRAKEAVAAAKAADAVPYAEAVIEIRKALYGLGLIEPLTLQEKDVLKLGASHPDYSKACLKYNQRELQAERAEMWLASLTFTYRGAKRVSRDILQAVRHEIAAADTGSQSLESPIPLPTIPPEQAAPQKRWPGRPRADSRPLIEAEFSKRWANGERHPGPTGDENIAEWWRELMAWLATEYPNIQGPTLKAFRASLGPVIREFQNAARTA